MAKTTIVINQIARFLRVKEQKCDSLSKNEQITYVTFFKERFAHNCSLLKSDERKPLTVAL